MRRLRSTREKVRRGRARGSWAVLLALMLILAMAPAPAAAVPAAQEQERQISYGETVGEILTSRDPAHAWQFEGSAGDSVSIQMDAVFDPDFVGLDTLLVLEYEDGTILAEDDDGGEGTNSRIENFQLPADGSYVIIATSYSGEDSGRYELHLELVDRSARHIEYTGAIGYREQVSAELTPDVVAHLWEFEGGAGDEISIAMNALSEELDPFLLLLAMSEPLATGELSLEEFFSLSEDELADLDAAADERGVLLDVNDDRDEGGLDSLIPSFVLPEDGRYFIVATSCCTGESSGPYELSLDVAGAEEPTPPSELVPNLQGFFPREGQAGSDLILTLEGENFSALGLPVGVVLGGIEIPLLGSELLSDASVELAVTIPEGASPGQQEISFFFENGGFDGIFFVAEPRGKPVVDPPSVLLPIIVGGGVLLGLMFVAGMLGLAGWQMVLRPKTLELPVETPSPPTTPAPVVRFEHNWDTGRQSIEPAGRPLRADVDIRFRLSLEQSDQTVDGDASSLHG